LKKASDFRAAGYYLAGKIHGEGNHNISGMASQIRTTNSIFGPKKLQINIVEKPQIFYNFSSKF
jgi:hypothetical protein